MRKPKRYHTHHSCVFQFFSLVVHSFDFYSKVIRFIINYKAIQTIVKIYTAFQEVSYSNVGWVFLWVWVKFLFPNNCIQLNCLHTFERRKKSQTSTVAQPDVIYRFQTRAQILRKQSKIHLSNHNKDENKKKSAWIHKYFQSICVIPFRVDLEYKWHLRWLHGTLCDEIFRIVLICLKEG